jgi:hypothetical protein
MRRLTGEVFAVLPGPLQFEVDVWMRDVGIDPGLGVTSIEVVDDLLVGVVHRRPAPDAEYLDDPLLTLHHVVRPAPFVGWTVVTPFLSD